MIIEHSCVRYSEKISHYRIIQTGSFSRHTLSHLFSKAYFSISALVAENHALLSKAMKKYGGINFEKVNL